MRNFYFFLVISFGYLAHSQQLTVVGNETKNSYEGNNYLVEGALNLTNGFSYHAVSGGDLFYSHSMRPGAFVTIWKTDNPGSTNDNQIRINTEGTGYNYEVYWGDGKSDKNVAGSITHTYASEGTYAVSIVGSFPKIRFNSNNGEKILSVEQWGSIQWEDFSHAFSHCKNLAINASDAPDLGLVTDMSYMFSNAHSMNQNIDHWNVSNVTNMSYMFNDAFNFNQPLNSWNVGSVENMSGMFNNAYDFNQDISSWNVSSVTETIGMFSRAFDFNQDIGGWNTHALRNAGNMFNYAVRFNQDISTWNLTNIESLDGTFNNSGFQTENYDNLLAALATDPNTPSNITLGALGVEYCNSEADRNYLLSQLNWSISDLGSSCPITVPFISEWATGLQSYIQLSDFDPSMPDYRYNFTVEWEEKGTSNGGSLGPFSSGFASIPLQANKEYIIKVYGTFPMMFFNSNNFQLMSIEQWGDNQWKSLSFANCVNMELNALDNPDLTKLKSLNGFFANVSAINSNISGWDVSGIEDFNSMFYEVDGFNQDLSSWDMSSATSISSMFGGASAFNQDLSGWDVSNVESMTNVFWDASSFDQNLGAWNIQSVDLFLGQMFRGTSISTANYDGTLSGWAGQSTVPQNITLNSIGLTYCNSVSDRNALINTHGWTISGDILDCANASRIEGEIVQTIEEVESEGDTKLAFFPNPVQQLLSISGNVSNVQAIKIYDLSGNRLEFSQQMMNEVLEIDLSKFENGIYLLKVLRDDGSSINHKIKVKH